MKRTIICTAGLSLLLACSRGPEVTGNGFVSSPAGGVRPVATSGAATTPGANAGTAESAAPAVAASADYREVTLPAGTVLPVNLETAVASDTSRVEQSVQGRLRRAVMAHGVDVLPAGTAVSGHVTSVQRPGKVKGLAYIAMRFTRIDTPGAGSERMSTAAVSRTGRATKEKDTLKIVAPAAAGAVIGRIAGGKSGAAKGAVIGGGAGTALVLSTAGQEVEHRAGATLTARLKKDLDVRMPIQ